MSLTQTSNLSHENDIIYHNIYVSNNTKTSLPINFYENRPAPILARASDYNMSVIRFTLPLTDNYIFEFIDNNWFLSLRYYDGVVYKNFQQYIQYIPIVNPNYIQATATKKVWQYHNFIKSINNAIALAVTDLNTTESKTIISNQPFLKLDIVTKLVSYIADVNNISGSNAVQLFMSEKLFNFFESLIMDTFMILNLPIGVSGGQPDPSSATNLGPGQEYANGLSNQTFNSSIVSGNNGVNGVTSPTYSANILPQEYPTLFNWNEFRGIAFLSSNIPVGGDVFSVSNIDGSAIQDATAPQYKILTDFEIENNIGTEAVSLAQYLPTAEYRLIPMVSSLPLQAIDLSVKLIDTKGIFHTYKLSPGMSFSIKLMYRKKAL